MTTTAAVTISLTLGEITVVLVSVSCLIGALLRYILEHKYAVLEAKYTELSNRLDAQETASSELLSNITTSIKDLDRIYHELDKEVAVKIAKEGRT